VVVEPNLRSTIRAVTSQHSANALYTGAREEVAQQITKDLVGQLGARGVEVQSVLLRDIQLPQMLKGSIEAKQQAEQEGLDRILLEAGIWIIEGLDLSAVRAGRYEMICLPVKLHGSDGAPARAILRPIAQGHRERI